MKRTHLFCASIVVWLSATFFGVYYAIFLCVPTHFFIVDDGALKEAHRLFLHELLRTTYRTYAPSDCSPLIKQHAPYIKQIDVRLRPYKKIALKYSLEKPLALLKLPECIKVITTDGHLIESTIFQEQNLDALLTISATSIQTENLAEMVEWVRVLPVQVIEQFAITWNNKTEIILLDRSAAVRFVITTKTPLDDLFIQKTKKLTAVLRARQLANHKIKSWVIDMRFNHIIPVRRNA